MAFQPIAPSPPPTANPYWASVNSFGGRVATYAATLPLPSQDGDMLVTGGGTIGAAFGSYKYATSVAARKAVEKAAEKAAGQVLQPGNVAKLKFGMTNLMGAARTTALVTGAVSTVKNIFQAWNGTITGTRAAGNVTADVAGAFGGGLLAAGAAGMITAAVGLPAVGLLGAVIGAAGFFGLDYLYRTTGLHRTVSDVVTNFLDSLFGRPPGGGHGGM